MKSSRRKVLHRQAGSRAGVVKKQAPAGAEPSEGERRLRNVLQCTPVPGFVIGRDHRVLYWNRALEELSGIRAHEVLGTADHWRAFYRSGARPCLADLLVEGDFEAL